MLSLRGKNVQEFAARKQHGISEINQKGTLTRAEERQAG